MSDEPPPIPLPAEPTVLDYMRSADKPASLFFYRAGLLFLVVPLAVNITCTAGVIASLIPLPSIERFYGPLIGISMIAWIVGLGFAITYWKLSWNDPGHPTPATNAAAGWCAGSCWVSCCTFYAWCS